VSVLANNGDGTFQAPVNYLVNDHGSHPTALVAADFNGDGKPDLAVTSLLPGGVSVLLNTSPPPNQGAPVVTTTALTADVSSAVAGQPVTLTATVTAALGTATGTVTFLDGTTVLGEVAVDPNGQATLVLPLGAGVHSLRASFAGIAPFTASSSAVVSETVNKAATTAALSAEVFAQNSDGSAFVFLTATVGPVAPGVGVPTGTVTFFDGTRVLGTARLDAHGQAFLDVEALPAGTHALTVAYGGDANFEASTSDPFTLTI
jgi:hypothetical protein